jgi:hypothetical protein
MAGYFMVWVGMAFNLVLEDLDSLVMSNLQAFPSQQQPRLRHSVLVIYPVDPQEIKSFASLLHFPKVLLIANRLCWCLISTNKTTRSKTLNLWEIITHNNQVPNITSADCKVVETTGLRIFKYALVF